MPISWNEIRHNAVAFAKDWAGVSHEDAEVKNYYVFLPVPRISRYESKQDMN
jgi:hypothetical protein